MTVAANPVPGPRLGPPVDVGPDDTAWDQVRADLLEHGTVVLYALRRDLRPRMPDGEGLRGVLGRDWLRYLDLADEEVRDRYVASRTLVRSAAVVLHGDPDALHMAFGPAGRPYLRGCGRVDVSLSYTGELLVVGLTTLGLIGVDAEPADRELYGSGLGRQVCTPYETVSLAALPEEQRNARLVRLWTLKAAYGKAIGQGARLRFTEFGFGPDGRPVRAQRPDGTPASGDEWAFRTYPVAGDHCVSVAVYDAGYNAGYDAVGYGDAGNELPDGSGPTALLDADREGTAEEERGEAHGRPPYGP